MAPGSGPDTTPAALDSTREITTIWSAEALRSVRSARTIVLLALYLMFTGMAGLGANFLGNLFSGGINAQIEANSSSPEEAAENRGKVHDGLVGKAFVDDPAYIEALHDVPLSVLFVFKLTLMFLPLYIALLGFDQISGEVGPRSMRYLIVRSRRSSILLGKVLAQALVLFALIVVVNVLIFAFARAGNADFAIGPLVFNLARFTFAAAVFSVAYLGLTSLCSALFATPAVSLVMNLLALFGLWLMNAVGDYFEATEGASLRFLRYARFLTPSHYSNGLLYLQPLKLGGAVLAYLVFGVVFLAIAHAALRRRDL